MLWAELLAISWCLILVLPVEAYLASLQIDKLTPENVYNAIMDYVNNERRRKRDTSECDEAMRHRTPYKSFCCLRTMSVELAKLRQILHPAIFLPLVLVVPYCAGLCRPESDPNWRHLYVNDRTSLLQQLLKDNDNNLAAQITRCVPVGSNEAKSQEIYFVDETSDQAVMSPEIGPFHYRNVTIRNFHITNCGCSA